MSYRYTEQDLLAQPPYHYTYSLFEGRSFLDDYERSRRAALMTLQAAAVQRVVTSPQKLQTRESWNGEVDTGDWLVKLVDYVQAGGDVRAANFRGWIDFFVAKFEPGKRLWLRYGRDRAIVDRTPIDRSGYAQLAFVVAVSIVGPEELRLINALLKLNDILLSGPPLGDMMAALVLVSVECELNLIVTLSTRLKISPAMSEC